MNLIRYQGIVIQNLFTNKQSSSKEIGLIIDSKFVVTQTHSQMNNSRC